MEIALLAPSEVPTTSSCAKTTRVIQSAFSKSKSPLFSISLESPPDFAPVVLYYDEEKEEENKQHAEGSFVERI